MGEGFRVVVEVNGDSALVRVVGDIDLAARDELRNALHDACDVDRVRLVVVDLSEMTFCDSSGISALLAAKNEAAARQVEIFVTGASPSVRRVFEIAGVADRFLGPPDAQ